MLFKNIYDNIKNTKPYPIFMDKIKIENHSFTGFSWFAGWLFTIGFLQLTFWKAVFALLLWPYYIGQYINALISYPGGN